MPRLGNFRETTSKRLKKEFLMFLIKRKNIAKVGRHIIVLADRVDCSFSLSCNHSKEQDFDSSSPKSDADSFDVKLESIKSTQSIGDCFEFFIRETCLVFV